MIYSQKSMQPDCTYYRNFILTLTAGVCLNCHHTTGPQIPYVPQITFTGNFNGDYDSLAGNRSWPNRCALVGDTVRIYCYSTFFSESNRIRYGDQLRIDLLPDSADGFQKRNTLFHLARYYERNESYTVNKGDTIENSIRFETEVVSFSRTVGGEIELQEIYVATPVIPGTGGRYLTITHGHLFGSIHRQ